jgi:hypothetical protein
MADGRLAPTIVDCCLLLGAFVAPGAYLPLAMAALAGPPVGSRACVGALAALAALLEGAGARPASGAACSLCRDLSPRCINVSTLYPWPAPDSLPVRVWGTAQA